MTELPSSTELSGSALADPQASFELRGTPITPGLAMGIVHRKDHDLSRADMRRVPLESVEAELNRFHASLRASKDQLEKLKDQLRGRVPAEHILILDTHIAYLRDSVFLSDVENLILNEQMCLQAAIAKVISDFDRIFRLVENELLRDRAIDLRDVGIRVLRNMEPEDEESQAPEPENFILVARELSIVDMFQLDGKQVRGIATEEGGLSSHAAILARSMGVPTVTGLDGLREAVDEGDFVILDATEGVVRVHPDEVVREQFREARESGDAQREGGVKALSTEAFKTADGTQLTVHSACGNLPEVEQARLAGLDSLGLYRTELLYLIGKQQPSLESLVAHYAAVLAAAGEGSITFRLLDLNSNYGVQYLHESREPNPALGIMGVRVLLARGNVLRRQLEAILRVAVDGTHVRIAVPFVTDASELRGVKEALFDVRSQLQRDGHRLSADITVGAIIETPAAALGVSALLAEVDFLFISYDGLVQYLLASDRENHELSGTFALPHPVVFRVIRDVVAAAEKADCPLHVFGASALQPGILPLMVASGLRDFCVPPVLVSEVSRIVKSVDLPAVAKALPKVLGASCAADTLPIVDNLLRAYDEADGNA
jgi:phosphotransferase system enzyme I (PtsI)